METNIFERDRKTWTRFKVKVKELQIYARLLKKWVDINKPVKQSSRYIYFEVEGDILEIVMQRVDWSWEQVNRN